MTRARGWIAICLSFLGVGMVRADWNCQVGEKDGGIVAVCPGYELRVAREPYALAVWVSDRQVLASGRVTPSVASSFITRDGRRHGLTRVEKYSAGANLLFLTVSTEGQGPAVSVVLNLDPGRITLRWGPADGLPAASLEDNYSLAASGHWYGGNITSAHNWPLERAETVLDPFLATSNQTVPVWLTSKGCAIFAPTYDKLGYAINQGGSGLFSLRFHDTSAAEYQILPGRNIVEAHQLFVRQAGKPSRIPPMEYFTEPIFNTWIEFMTDVDQESVVSYARKIREMDFPCRVLELDDGWMTHYGDFRFEPKKFPNPGQMVDEIRKLGFKFAVWAVPFVDPASDNFKLAAQKGYLVKDATGAAPYITQWWNGKAGLVDFSNPAAYSWFLGELQGLQRAYGLNGFKLDGGDAEYLAALYTTFGNISPNRYTDLYASLGQYFEINELRVSWLVQPLGLVQRLRDKSSDWSVESGLGALMPHGLTEGLIGFPYSCPDIIGGGLDSSFQDPNYKGMDPELFVRWTETSALMPMMQFSYAPWKLDEKSMQICRDYARLHQKLGEYIYRQAQEARETGMPIVKPLFFRNPEDEATYTVGDEFLLGDKLLVAPVVKKGARTRDIYLPAGLWKDFWSGEIYPGEGTLKDFPAPLERLPIFVSL